MIQSTPTNKAEKDHPDNISLAGDGFDVVIKAKKALDAIPSCKNKVSCADILALATRDVVVAVSYIFHFLPISIKVFLGKRNKNHMLNIKTCVIYYTTMIKWCTCTQFSKKSSDVCRPKVRRTQWNSEGLMVWCRLRLALTETCPDQITKLQNLTSFLPKTNLPKRT